MTDRPIPEPIYRRLVAWLEAGGTGRIELHARSGQILAADFPGERVRHNDPVLESPQPHEVLPRGVPADSGPR